LNEQDLFLTGRTMCSVVDTLAQRFWVFSGSGFHRFLATKPISSETQGSDDNDVYFILAGNVEILVNGRAIPSRGADEGAVQARQESTFGRENLEKVISCHTWLNGFHFFQGLSHPDLVLLDARCLR